MWVVFYCFVEINIFSVSFIAFTSTRLHVLRYIGILDAGECFSQAFFQLLFLQLQNPYNTNRMNAISFCNYNKFIGLQKVLIRPNDFCGFNNIINNLIENQQISILTIIMQSFKGLISRNLVSQQSMSAITKKTEQFRKITLQSSQITISLLKIYETYLLQLSRIMSLLLEETGEHESYYKTLKSIYSQIYKQYHHFILDYLQTPSNQITNSNSQRYINFSGCALTFQKQMKNYTGSEAFLLELAKKYFKSQKNLLSSIQAYKQSFTEAKLIYNMDQKLRRYAACEQNHKNVEQDHTLVHEAKQKLLGKKKQVIQTFQLLSKEMSLHQNEVNVKTFLFLSKFNINLTQNLKKRLAITKQGRKRIQSIKIPNFFNSFTLEQIHVMTQSTNDFESRRKKLNISNSPTGNIMDGNAENMKRLYAKLEKHIEVTKHEHLTMYQFHVQFYKSAQKKSVAQLKQSLSNFERNKKKIKEQFTKFCYQQFKNTLQIIRVTMDVYSEVQKKIGAKMQSVYENIEQLKIILQKLLQDVSFQVQKVLNPNKQNEIIQYKQKLSHIGGIIKTADDRLTNVIMHIKQSYNEILNIYELGINESHDRCTQFSKISQDKQEEMISHIREYKNERLKTTIFVELLNEQNRGTITFDDEIQKNNDFKKLKKPVQIEIIQKEKQPNLSLTPISSSKQQMEKQQLADIDDKNQISPQKNKRKHKQFIQTKVSFVQGEEFINTFSCALADKIILQGRLYVTSHRICFYSNFNPSLVFFRETFIQVPKKDIITLQKRKNGIFFDNSISITTKNGELFLTSFFKRNQAFKLVSQLIGLNYQQQAYEHDNAFQSDTSQMGSPEKKPKVQQPQQLEDDMKEQSLPSRLQAIQNMMNLYTYNFKQCAKGQFISDSLTAYKLLKVFLLDSQFSMNGKKYSSFCEYYKKSILGHKDIETTAFDPPIKQYLNPSNITSSCPTKFTRKVNSVVPTPSSGIPFMPKWAKTSQSQSLYIISKHKWVLDTQLENSGAPYTDSFKVYYRTICESGTSPCRIVTSMFINFTKNVMVRSIIESKTQQQSKTQLGKQYEQLKKYLQSQQRQKMKSLKLMSGTKKDSEQQIIGDQTLNQQKIRSLEQKIENINIKHEKQIQKFKKQIKMFKGALIIIILISLIMWIV